METVQFFETSVPLYEYRRFRNLEEKHLHLTLNFVSITITLSQLFTLVLPPRHFQSFVLFL